MKNKQLRGISPSSSIAVVCARGLGDALLSMILSHNLSQNVTTFSSILCQLQSWFPNQKILPFPEDKNVFAHFEVVIAADHSLVRDTDDFGNELIILKESEFDKKRSMAENLKMSSKSNGIIPPKKLVWKKYPKRIIIHPTSADPKKNWSAKKFIKLAQKLKKDGFEPVFCVSPDEREQWPSSPLFPTVSDLAAFVYESGLMVGNDSGVGHLASCLNIPTVSLFARKSYSHLWRPDFGQGFVVTPLEILPGARLKQKYWRELLFISKVKKAIWAMNALASTTQPLN